MSIRILLVTTLLLSAPTAQAQEAGVGDKAAKAACPIVPMKLELVQKPQEKGLSLLMAPSFAMALGEDGSLRIPLMLQSPSEWGKTILDPRGCLVDGVEVWADQTAGGKIWTLRQEMATATCALQLPTAWLVIDKDGFVQRQKDPKGKPDPNEPATLRFTGFKPEGCCAARLMLAAYLGMMPSMAVSDGNPIALPPPKDSACPERHKNPGK